MSVGCYSARLRAGSDVRPQSGTEFRRGRRHGSKLSATRIVTRQLPVPGRAPHWRVRGWNAGTIWRPAMRTGGRRGVPVHGGTLSGWSRSAARLPDRRRDAGRTPHDPARRRLGGTSTPGSCPAGLYAGGRGGRRAAHLPAGTQRSIKLVRQRQTTRTTTGVLTASGSLAAGPAVRRPTASAGVVAFSPVLWYNPATQQSSG